MNKPLILLSSIGTMLGLTLFTSSAIGEEVNSFAPYTDTPTNGVWYEADVRPGGTAAIVDLTGLGGNLEFNQPRPIGAAKLTTDFTNAAKAEVAVVNDYGTVDNILSKLNVSYDYFKVTNGSQNLAAAPSIKLTFLNTVCLNSSGDCYGTLVYEPYWNGVSGPSNPPLDTWTPVNISASQGDFWWTGGFGQPNTAGGPPLRTLNEWFAAFSSDFPGASLVSISVGVGSYNQGQIGYFDNVAISGTNADATYDFEPAPQFETVGECVSTLIAENCSTLHGRDRANCNHTQQLTCFDIFGVK